MLFASAIIAASAFDDEKAEKYIKKGLIFLQKGIIL